ncbi:hypothetical protein MKK84_29680 [Methylobacterium sp. E-065]|uniref:hypothetical protein n=1 Tax=Methylobacterium sp. E-065 TaxID=2836583 RepID=UPI001FB9A780|nr:hypothetical protein [Methylobacterium sp. E-065]MCJ2021539.1 hypothetical protein [Methylobacterium sp. E-065]
MSLTKISARAAILELARIRLAPLFEGPGDLDAVPDWLQDLPTPAIARSLGFLPTIVRPVYGEEPHMIQVSELGAFQTWRFARPVARRPATRIEPPAALHGG